MQLAAYALFALSFLGTTFALPAVDEGSWALDAAPALLVRNHQGKLVSKDLLASCPGGPGSPNVRKADRCTLVSLRTSMSGREDREADAWSPLLDQYCQQPYQAHLDRPR